MLGHIGDAPCPLATGHMQQILPVKQHPPLIGIVDAQNILKQRGLTAAVLAQNNADLAVLQRQIHAPQHLRRTLAVAKLQVFNRQHQPFSFFEKMMAIKKGAPKSDVIAPTGSAEPLPRLRESVSAASSSKLPQSAEAGMDRR